MALAIKANRSGNSDSSRSSGCLSRANSSNSIGVLRLEESKSKSSRARATSIARVIRAVGLARDLISNTARLVSR